MRLLLDPSVLLRPEDDLEDNAKIKYRDYSVNEEDPIKERVRKTYLQMHTYQTVDFVKQKRKQWLKFNHCKMNIRQALELLNTLVDESDPDTDLPNIVHAFQTAERARNDHPELEWLHFACLIHDLGKLLAILGEPQWATVGDTFPVGCEWAESIVYRETSFENNPDRLDKVYNSKYGIYKPNCGLDNIMMSWGHDEYLYQVLVHNGCTLPDVALYCIRFHSFYPYHSGNSYQHLTSEKDKEMLPWLKLFNSYDLYTKTTEVPDIDALWPYYQKLIGKFMPGEIKW